MDMNYKHILDTLNRCRRLAQRFSDLRDRVDGLLMTGTNMIARYSPSTGSTSHAISDPVYDHVQRIDALTEQMEAVWSDYRNADYKAKILIRDLNISAREKDVLDAYYRELSSEYVIEVWFAEQRPAIHNADDLNRARKGVLRKLRRKQTKLVNDKRMHRK